MSDEFDPMNGEPERPSEPEQNPAPFSPYDEDRPEEPKRNSWVDNVGGYNTYNNGPAPSAPQGQKPGKGPWLGLLVAVMCLAVVIGGLLLLVKMMDLEKKVADQKAEETTVAESETAELTKETKEEKEEETKGEKPTASMTVGDKIDSTGNVNATILDVSGVVEEVMPAVVAVTNTSVYKYGNNSFQSWFYGYSNNDENYKATGAGSGVILAQTEKELLIVTNAHVILPEDYSGYGLTVDSSEYKVDFCDGNSCTAQVKGYDESADLAIIVVKTDDIKKETKDAIKIATVGNSDDLKVGNGVIAIGNALGFGQSVTVGYISAVNREVKFSDNKRTLLQTDAAINPGNSGGGLFDTHGRLIGINAAKYSSTAVEGVGYAIPITSAEEIITNLMNKETVIREKVTDKDKQAFLGVLAEKQYSAAYEGKGAFVGSVVEGGAAEKAGIMAYDIITAIGDVEITSWTGLQEELTYHEGGETVHVTYYTLVEKDRRREYVETSCDVVLGFKKDYTENEDSTEK